MPTLPIVIAPGYTATLQPSIRGGAPVGSPISPTVVDTVYTFDLSSLANGDYDMQLSGNWEKSGQKFPCRLNATEARVADYWWELEANQPIIEIPTLPPPITGLCDVVVAITFNGDAVVGGRATCTLEGQNNTVSGYLVSRAVESGTTNSSGICILRLIQFGQFTRGGLYRLKTYDAEGKLLHDRRVKIPNTPNANAEALEDA